MLQKKAAIVTIPLSLHLFFSHLGEKVPEQGGALRLQDVPHDFGVVAEVLLKEVQDGAAGPKARVFGPIVDLRDPCRQKRQRMLQLSTF